MKTKFLLIISSFLLSIAITKAQTTRYVPGNYPTIQAAITASSAGDIIEVSAGTYTETISLSKNITLRGPNYLKHGADNTRSGEAILLNSRMTISNGVFEGFRFEWSTDQRFSAITVSGGNLTIRNQYCPKRFCLSKSM